MGKWCKTAISLAKDDINRLREEEGGMLHFDALILGGCKFYCLRKEGCEYITKCKGYKKSKGEELSFEDFETMASGGEKAQKQKQVSYDFKYPTCNMFAQPLMFI